MIRRRRPTREIFFSFDSFLDVVANVVGIIIRMILVVWVGARAYTSLHLEAPRLGPGVEATMPEIKDPLEQELAKRRQELAKLEQRLAEQLHQLEENNTGLEKPAQELAQLGVRLLELEQERDSLNLAGAEGVRKASQTAVSLEMLKERNRKLRDEIALLERQSPATKTFRYQSPVSQPVQTEELIFECRGGRVSFIDVDALLQEVRRDLREKGQQLRSRWEISGITNPIGAFRLQYTIERQRDSSLPIPDPRAEFRYGISGWRIDPIVGERGENVESALAPKSEFRQVIDYLDPQTTTITFCVYPDSFTLYRQLRDYLHARELVVAGRPLPEGHPIASSRNGTISRGQ